MIFAPVWYPYFLVKVIIIFIFISALELFFCDFPRLKDLAHHFSFEALKRDEKVKVQKNPESFLAKPFKYRVILNITDRVPSCVPVFAENLVACSRPPAALMQH